MRDDVASKKLKLYINLECYLESIINYPLLHTYYFNVYEMLLPICFMEKRNMQFEKHRKKGGFFGLVVILHKEEKQNNVSRFIDYKREEIFNQIEMIKKITRLKLHINLEC